MFNQISPATPIRRPIAAVQASWYPYWDRYQPETQQWLWNVNRNGGTLTTKEILIADALAYAINQTSYRSQIIYLMPLIGNVIKASIVPLIDDQGVGIPNNTGATAFVDGDCGTALGIKGTNNAILVTGKLPGVVNSSLGGLGYWERNYNSTGGTTTTCGANNFVTTVFDGRYVIDLRTGAEFFSFGAVGNRATTATTGGNHHYYGEKSSNVLRTLYRDGTSVATNTTSDTAPGSNLTTGSIAILGLAPAATGAYAYNKGTCGVFYITQGGMGSTNAAAFHTLLNTYLITATGR